MTPPVFTVVDSDPGIDDAVALALAARSPELNLVAVTTTYGNAGLAQTTRNARAVLALAGRPGVPVLPGADRPLRRPPPPVSEKHGARGAGYATLPEGSPTDRAPAASASALLEALAHCPPDRRTTLVTLGPLTNLAHALRGDGALVRSRVGRHVAVLGTDGPDFNATADPDAVDVVLTAGLPIDLVPPAVTRGVILSREAMEQLAGRADPLVRWLTDALRWYVEVHERLHGLAGCWVHDAVGMADVVKPGVLDFASPPSKIGTRIARSVRDTDVRQLLGRVFGVEGDRPSAGGS